jgi:hypothetical protein
LFGAGRNSAQLFFVTFNFINFIGLRFRGWTLKSPAQRQALNVRHNAAETPQKANI